MNPWGLAKSGSEHSEQAALMHFIAIATNYGFATALKMDAYEVKGFAASDPDAVAMPQLHWIFAIPNGGSRGSDKRSAMIAGAQMKAEGVKPGVSDLCVPLPRHGKHGLFIEMKRADGGTVSSEQKAFGSFVMGEGYGFCVCYGWIEAAKVIMRWMGYPEWAKLAPLEAVESD